MEGTQFNTLSLQAFAGVEDDEQRFSTLGRIRSTVTSSRQIQFGLRTQF